MKDKKILIVDFDEESLISLSNLVYEEGFQAVTASDGLSGYEKFKADDFDLVILEPMLPKLHGFELCKKINQDPLNNPPIIFVTGIYREPSCKMEAFQVFGASAFFTKPWNKDELRSKILQLLVEGKENQPKKEAEPAAPARNAAPEAREALTSKAVPREPKMSKDMDEIEKELQEVVSSFVSHGQKKEINKKKEPKPDVDKEIEAMLKGAIGELGLEEKKKKVEAAKPELKLPSEPKAVNLEPLLKAISIPKPEPWSEKKEKIPIAEEIKGKIPSEEKTGNNIPLSASRVHLDTEKTRFGIDKTLIEIDKIPLDLEKGPAESEKVTLEEEKPPVEKKKALFDEYAEPRKKKTTFLFIGGLVIFIFIASSATFYILKSKKTSQPSREIVSSLQPTLPTEFSTRQNEIMASQVSRENEAKQEAKKTPARPVEQPASDIIEQIQPALPAEVPPVKLDEQPGFNLEPIAQKSEPPGPVETNQPETVSQAPIPQSQVSEPAQEKTKEGSLVPLDNVDVPPALLKRVEPKYPAFALNIGLGGTVTVNALIAETGDVIRTEILKGIKGGSDLEKAAEDALKQWKFRPAKKDGVNVKVWKPFEFNFKVNTSVKE
jgi:TonB family protein